MNVIEPQQAIDIFENENGGISISQEDFLGEKSVIWFLPEHAEKIANAILQIRAEIEKSE